MPPQGRKWKCPLIKPLLGDTFDFAKVLKQLAEGDEEGAEREVKTAREQLKAQAQDTESARKQGRPSAQSAEGKVANSHLKPASQLSSCSWDRILPRLARDAPEVLDRVKAGEFRSARAAAIEAGIIRPVPTIRLVDDLAKVAAALGKHLDQEQFHRLMEAMGKRLDQEQLHRLVEALLA